MIRSSRARTLVAGLTIILAVNAIALAGVAYNRSGTPDSTLRLSQRELRTPYWLGGALWSRNDENSGIALLLKWRVLERLAEPSDSDADADALFDYSGGYAREANWLDAEKLTTLGFSLPAPASQGDDSTGFRRLSSREVLLVLEQDGPAFQQTLERMQRWANNAQSKLVAEPANKNLQRQAAAAQTALAEEAGDRSRLFVIDAGLDAEVLRSLYPDRSRFAIVYGLVRAQWRGTDGTQHWRGYIDALSLSTINVPKEFRPMFEKSGQPTNEIEKEGNSFEAEVAFGKRLEPWIASVNGKR